MQREPAISDCNTRSRYLQTVLHHALPSSIKQPSLLSFSSIITHFISYQLSYKDKEYITTLFHPQANIHRSDTMRSNAILSSLLFGSIAIAQDVQSKPFNLVIHSADTKLNGQKFAACHTGAAIESLCLAGVDGSEFFFNTTEGSQTPLEGYEPAGTLVWNLPIGKLYPPL